MAQNRQVVARQRPRRVRREGLTTFLLDQKSELSRLAIGIAQCPRYQVADDWWRLWEHGPGRCTHQPCAEALAGLHSVIALVSDAPDALDEAALALNGFASGGSPVTLRRLLPPWAWVDPETIRPVERGRGHEATLWFGDGAGLQDVLAAVSEAWPELERQQEGRLRQAANGRRGVVNRPGRDFWLLLAARRDGRRGKYGRASHAWRRLTERWASDEATRPASAVERRAHVEWQRPSGTRQAAIEDLTEVQVRDGVRRAEHDLQRWRAPLV